MLVVALLSIRTVAPLMQAPSKAVIVCDGKVHQKQIQNRIRVPPASADTSEGSETLKGGKEGYIYIYIYV